MLDTLFLKVRGNFSLLLSMPAFVDLVLGIIPFFKKYSRSFRSREEMTRLTIESGMFYCGVIDAKRGDFLSF